MPNGSALWERAVVCRPTHPKTAHLQLSGVKTFVCFFTKHHMGQHSRPFETVRGQLAREGHGAGQAGQVRGPGTKLQEGQDKRPRNQGQGR